MIISGDFGKLFYLGLGGKAYILWTKNFSRLGKWVYI